MKMSHLTSGLAFLIVIALFTACKPSQKNLNYLADKRDSTHSRIWESYETRIQPGDKLSIFVTALNPESAKPYNFVSLSTAGGSPQGITVDQQGRILYPQLGFIKAAGLTKSELRDTLLGRLKTYLTDPVATVEFIDSKITILGEVNKQGPLLINDRRVTILEALGQAGDITTTGRRDSVLVIREAGGKREFGYINLLSNDLFKSPYFLLQQNDVVYVQMNDKRLRSETEEKFVRNLSLVTSVLAVLSTLGILILNITK
jgi:polysaccharide biosynthesis/export protein